MTTPNPFEGITPEESTVIADHPVPDHTQGREERRQRLAEKTGFLGKLGQNKKARSTVRQLTEKDREKIENVYGFAALAFSLPGAINNDRASRAFAEAAEPCADAWFELAKENDAVRRVILMVIEGGAWGAVMMAHLPIMMAFMPDSMTEKLGMFAPVPTSPEGRGE